MKCPKGTVTFVAMLTILLAAGLITLPSSILVPVLSAAQAPSENERPADVAIQILSSKPQRAVKVAILSGPHFDAMNVDPASVTLAGAPVMRNQNKGFKASVKDVNADGHSDLILQFSPNGLKIGAGPTKVSLEGLTYAGAGFRGINCLQPSGEPCGGTVNPVIGRDTEDAGRHKQLSIQAITFSENFDGVTAPNLPAGWSAITATDCPNSDPWATSSAGTPAPPADTPPNAAFVTDADCISDERLQSPPISITSTTAKLTFRHNYSLESGFDGGVLEVSTNGGATFQDVLAAGCTFSTGGYNGTISESFGSPIAGRQAWTDTSSGFVTVTVNFPASFSGTSIILRWRRGSDDGVGDQGWRVDTISIDDVVANCVLTCPANVTVPNDPNVCGAVVNYSLPTTSGNCGTVTCSPPPGSFFPVGTMSVTCTASAAPTTCSFTVTVQDTQPPTITCPANVTAGNDPGQCGAAVVYPAPTASDNCPNVNSQCSPASGSFFPVGTTTVSCTATDASGNTATCAFTVTVNDVEPPVISGASANPSSLRPPNHRFVYVTVSYTSTDNCGTSNCALSVTSNEPVDGEDDGSTAPDWIVVNNHRVKLRAERSGTGSGRVYTITITCTDSSGNSSSTFVTVTVPLND